MGSYQRWISKFEIKPGSWVFVPSSDSVSRGKEIKQLVQARWSAPRYFYHLREGGHISAVKYHLDSEYFALLDLHRFFYSVNRSKITRVLKSLLGYGSAREVAVESTVRHPPGTTFFLPFGFVQSPILASICLDKSKLGRTIKELIKQGIKITIYMDDIIISGIDQAQVQGAVEIIKQSAERSKFPLNVEKETGVQNSISAFNIVLAKHSMQLTDERFVEFLEAYKASESIDQIIGILGYIESVNTKQADLIR